MQPGRKRTHVIGWALAKSDRSSDPRTHHALIVSTLARKAMLPRRLHLFFLSSRLIGGIMPAIDASVPTR